ncbi:MAG: hypothetical protein HYS56_02340 [Candidatus Omnitrophica bacterium]|nr:hypothetical protein [Candidatus Omnitrophota bacterium]
MKNWPGNSIHWKVSLLTLERITLFLLIGISVFLAAARVLGRWEAFLMLFFLPLVAAVSFWLEMSAPNIRQWANTVILALMAVLAMSSAGSLSLSITQSAPWNPFPILITIQLFMGAMAFERRYLPLILEATLLGALLLLIITGMTVEFYLAGFLFLTVLIYFFRFSFAASQWIHTIGSKKEIWQKAPPSLKGRQILRVFLEGMVILALGIILGGMMSNVDWEISFPATWKKVIEQSVRIDKTVFQTQAALSVQAQDHDREERDKERELEEMRKLLEKPVEIQVQEVTEQEVAGQEMTERPPKEEKGILFPVGIILLLALLSFLPGMWVYFWMYRRRTKKRWEALKQKDAKAFLKAWFEYLRYLLGKYGVEPALFLSPAEYIERAFQSLKISVDNKDKFKQTLLKGWYSSLPVTRQEIDETEHMNRFVLDALSQRGSWRQRLQFHCLAVR